jgi:hypothetical protein
VIALARKRRGRLEELGEECVVLVEGVTHFHGDYVIFSISMNILVFVGLTGT